MRSGIPKIAEEQHRRRGALRKLLSVNWPMRCCPFSTSFTQCEVKNSQLDKHIHPEGEVESLEWVLDDPCIPTSAKGQHARLGALRELVKAGIPCILWGEDALKLVHRARNIGWFDQKILIPDALVESAAEILVKGPYKRALMPLHWREEYAWESYQGGPVFPAGIGLRHVDARTEEPYRLDPIPNDIVILPQSYYGFDIRSSERFQFLHPHVIDLDPLNGGILAPKFHTCIEGYVEFIFNPPGRPAAHQHLVPLLGLLRYKEEGWRFKNGIFNYEEKSQVEIDAGEELSPIEKEILDCLTTEDARWYLQYCIYKKPGKNSEEVEQYMKESNLRKRSPSGQAARLLTVSPSACVSRSFSTSSSRTLDSRFQANKPKVPSRPPRLVTRIPLSSHPPYMTCTLLRCIRKISRV